MVIKETRSTKKEAGRPAMGKALPMRQLHMSPEQYEAVTAWAATEPDNPSWPEATRRLVEIGLAHAPRRKAGRSKAAAKAKEMAGAQLDRLEDTSATPEERANRKRRLLKGPSEFRDLRPTKPKG